MKTIFNEIIRLNIEKKLNRLLFFRNAKEYSLQWGMNYILFSPSKRIRPLLLLEANMIFGVPDNDAYILAGAIEMIHTYSLVHDDLPSMDNDELRRGQKTLHILQDEAYAILVGDALLTRSFGILSKYSKSDKLPQIIDLINQKAGLEGMIHGQVLDIRGNEKTLEIESINTINKYKTGALLELSIMLGAINGGASSEQVIRLEKFGTILGHLFQLQDDILDIIGDKKELGKNIGSDEKNKKNSIPQLIGIEKTKNIMNSYKKEAYKYINDFQQNREFFYKLVDFFIERSK